MLTAFFMASTGQTSSVSAVFSLAVILDSLGEGLLCSLRTQSNRAGLASEAPVFLKEPFSGHEKNFLFLKSQQDGNFFLINFFFY